MEITAHRSKKSDEQFATWKLSVATTYDETLTDIHTSHTRLNNDIQGFLIHAPRALNIYRVSQKK